MFYSTHLIQATEDKFLYTTAAPSLFAADPAKSTGWIPGKEQ